MSEEDIKKKLMKRYRLPKDSGISQVIEEVGFEEDDLEETEKVHKKELE